MKRASNLLILLMFAISGSYLANAEDALPFDRSAYSNDAPDANSMTWPMLPGESVAELARLFYPDNQAMRQQFVSKTLRLNADAQVDLKAVARFDTPTLLTIPTLKSLSKTAVKVSHKSSNQSLEMSYGLNQVVVKIPQKLLQEYEELVNKNIFLKEQLARLNEKLVILQSKLDALKLIFDKTLTLPNAGLPNGQPPVKKVFKNLNKQIEQTPASEPRTQPAETSFLDRLNMEMVMTSLATIALLLLGAFVFKIILKRYRESIFDKLSVAGIKVQPTLTDISDHFSENSIVKEQQSSAVVQQVKATKHVETKDAETNTTLEEAKLLISVNRATDAIAHLKAVISSQPKASIRHWLYLLEVFRKFNMKDDFEQYAERLHQTFNMMTPVWHEKSAEIYVALSLEESPHIMDQLYGIWPGELASEYLRDLLGDNRGGDRAGFGEEVLDEILLLIAVLDTQKE